MKKYLSLILSCLFITNLYGAEIDLEITLIQNLLDYAQKFVDLYEKQKYDESLQFLNSIPKLDNKIKLRLLSMVCDLQNFDAIKYAIDNYYINNISTEIIEKAIYYKAPIPLIKYLINFAYDTCGYCSMDILEEACNSGNYEIVKFIIIEKKMEFDLFRALQATSIGMKYKESKSSLTNYIKIIIFLLKIKNIRMNIPSLESISINILAKLINKLLESNILYLIKTESFGAKIKSPEIIALFLTSNFNINNPEFDKYLKDIQEYIYRPYYITKLYNSLFYDKRLTIQKFLEVKNLIINIIDSGDPEKIKQLKSEHINLMFSNAQLAKFIVEKILDKSYNNSALEILIHKVAHRLEDLFYQEKHILNYALITKRRIISTLITTLCPTILDNLDNFLDYDNLLEFIDIGRQISIEKDDK